MSQCPKCNHEIKDDFGLVVCPECGLSVMVGMDGEVQSQDAIEESLSIPSMDQDNEASTFEELESMSSFSELQSDVNQNPETFNQQFDDIAPANYETEMPENNLEQGDYKNEFTSFETHQDEGLINEDAIDEQPVGMASQEQSPDSLVVNDTAETFSDEKTNFLAKEQLEKSKLVKPETELANLTEYANSKKSSVADGVLKYNILISGIDSYDIKNKVFEELSDKKLYLDIQLLKKSLKNGELCVPEVSAVKATIIINRLYHLPISILWDQYDIRKA